MPSAALSDVCAHVQAVLDGLQHQEATTERDPPPGTLAVTLHAYQKRALAWMLHREERALGARGGILAGLSVFQEPDATMPPTIF